MRGGESFIDVFTQIFDMCLVEGMSFTKADIEEMPPFERRNYYEMIVDMLKERQEAREKQNKK